eukprot:1254486-Prymnesium_polylepis.1
MDRLEFVRALPWAEPTAIDWSSAEELFEGLCGARALDPAAPPQAARWLHTHLTSPTPRAHTPPRAHPDVRPSARCAAAPPLSSPRRESRPPRRRSRPTSRRPR